MTCVVAGCDPRYKFAVPVYGCGFLGDNSAWSNPGPGARGSPSLDLRTEVRPLATQQPSNTAAQCAIAIASQLTIGKPAGCGLPSSFLPLICGWV